MTLTFLGSRGEIDTRTRRHRMHTSLLASYRRARVMIDCGLDWLGKLKRVEGIPRAIITHCGSEIVTGDERDIEGKIRAMAIERGNEVRITYDGMKVRI